MLPLCFNMKKLPSFKLLRIITRNIRPSWLLAKHLCVSALSSLAPLSEPCINNKTFRSEYLIRLKLCMESQLEAVGSLLT